MGKLIPFTCTVAFMDIMDMLDTHTLMDTMDTMESVMLRLNLRLIPLTCTVVCMDTMDTLDRYEPPQMNLTQKLDTNAFFFSDLHISVLDFNTRIWSRVYGEFVLL